MLIKVPLAKESCLFWQLQHGQGSLHQTSDTDSKFPSSQKQLTKVNAKDPQIQLGKCLIGLNPY